MRDCCLVDFHHGWLIEIMPSEQGFRATCYSPSRKRLIVQERYASDFDALYVAKREIDYQIACGSLSNAFREFYEAGQLCFEEWNSLHHSLIQAVKID
jgi:hypothetical protein